MMSRNINVVMGAGSLMFSGGLLGFGLATALWQFYLFAIPIGAGIAVLYTLCDSILVSSWFSPSSRGKFLGIAGACSGLGTFVWAPLFTHFIQAYGYQTAYFINAAVAFVLTFIPSAFLVKRSPADLGLLPYGYNEATEEVRQAMFAGANLKTALRCPAFWLIVLVTLCVCMGAGYMSSLPGIAMEKFSPGAMDLDAAAMLGATTISVAAIGNMTGKILFGFLRDKLGSRVAWLSFLAAFFLGFVGLAFCQGPVLFVASGFFFGFHFSLMSVATPLLARDIFGGKHYARIWSFLCVPFSIWGCASSSVVGKIFDMTGSYMPAVYFGMLMVAVVFVCIVLAHRYLGKVEFEPAE